MSEDVNSHTTGEQMPEDIIIFPGPVDRINGCRKASCSHIVCAGHVRVCLSGSKNPRLHTDEILIALSATAADSEDAKLALAQLPKLHKCQVHSSVMLSEVDRKTFQRLGCDVTCEPKF